MGVLSKGKQLKYFKLQLAHFINEASKTTQLGLFNFRSFLNIGMLLTESETAKQLRSKILDIVIATINERSGGGTKYINRRDANYLPAAITEENYRKNLWIMIPITFIVRLASWRLRTSLKKRVTSITTQMSQKRDLIEKDHSRLSSAMHFVGCLPQRSCITTARLD